MFLNILIQSLAHKNFSYFCIDSTVQHSTEVSSNRTIICLTFNSVDNMKKIFTLCFLVAGILFVSAQTVPHSGPTRNLGEVATDSLGYFFGTKTGWSITPTTDFPLVLDVTFGGWTQNHDKANSSLPTYGRAIPTAYADWNQTVNLTGPLAGQAAQIRMIKCAVAPLGLSQNKIDYTKPASDIFKGSNSNYDAGQFPDPEDGTPLPVGFLEVSRCNSNGTGANLSIAGAQHGTVTTPAIKGALVVQYSFSSIGGSKRALKLERSVNGGATWQIIRNPMKSTVQWNLRDSSAADVTYPLGATDVPTIDKPFQSSYFCSGSGVRLEDFIGNGEEAVMLRFTINDCWKDDLARDTTTLAGHVTGHAETQDYRLHSIKIIATANAQLSGVNNAKVSTTTVIGKLGQIELRGAIAGGNIYNGIGQKVAVFSAGNQTINLRSGIYMVVERSQPTVKVLVR